MDYISQSLNITFGPDETEKTIRVPIINDISRERSESFFGKLEISPQSESSARVTVSVAMVEISYSDCKQ